MPPLTRDTLPDDRELLPDFLAEGSEYLCAAEVALLRLEEDPTDEEALNTVFRAFHTVKGTAAFLGLTHIVTFAHAAESLLSRVREHQHPYTRDCATLSLRAVDMLTALLVSVSDALDGDGTWLLPAGYHDALRALTECNPDAIALAPLDVSTNDVVTDNGVTDAARAELTVESTIRIRTDRLDRLIEMVGELVIAQSMIAGDATLQHGDTSALAQKVTHTAKIVRELQDLSMSMRMVPLRTTFQKLARVVRDTAMKTGKNVQLITQGDEVEIDRALADMLTDPLIHMVRNAVDHGIERPSERDATRKARIGTVRLSACSASGQVVVQLTDDGRGLNREQLITKATQRGLIAPNHMMTDSDVYGLIFAPGFSTTESITDISGRGVGMDIVRRNLETMRGSIEITTTPGASTTFTMRLPLTLAVTDGMLVRVGGERFIVPLTHIHMSVRPDAEMLSTVIGQGEAVLLRGELLPIIRLHRVFDVPDAEQNPTHGLLMIVGDGDRRSALLVDELLGQQQVVAKPLSPALGNVPGVSGGAILGDGRVGLILDVNETVNLSHLHQRRLHHAYLG